MAEEHPVTRARKPFGLFLDILDFKLVAVDGRPSSGSDLFIRLDSKGRLFVKCKDTNDLWERQDVDFIKLTPKRDGGPPVDPKTGKKSRTH